MYFVEIFLLRLRKKLDDLANNSAGNKDTVNHQKSDGRCF